MLKVCDHTSVGVVLRNTAGQFALIERARGEKGFAPPAGHVDDHGSLEQTGIDEVFEEIGVKLNADQLRKTVIQGRRTANRCRRQDGDYHVWTVFEADVSSEELHADPDETKGASWHTPAHIQRLAERTKAYQAGHIPLEEWAQKPGLEEIWLDFLRELGYVK